MAINLIKDKLKSYYDNEKISFKKNSKYDKEYDINIDSLTSFDLDKYYENIKCTKRLINTE
jgi:hypothetical protein